MQVSVTVVNNDETPEAPSLKSTLASMPFDSRLIHEPMPGKSRALNSGIAASTADYLGFLDDDEELAADWFRIVEDALSGRSLDFIGGRTLPLGHRSIPGWVPPGYAAVLGLADAGPDAATYGCGFSGILMGGNAVISREMLRQAGPYNTELGPRVDRRLFSCEDEDMYWRLLEAGAVGRYLPHLIVYHHVHPERLRRSYYRAWCFWNGASKGVLSRRRRSNVPEVAGVPRYVYGNAFRGVFTCLRAAIRGPAHRRMAGELPIWHLAGRLYGRHLRRIGTPELPPGLPPAADSRIVAAL